MQKEEPVEAGGSPASGIRPGCDGLPVVSRPSHQFVTEQKVVEAPVSRRHGFGHVGLDFGLRERAVIDSDLVDAALEELSPRAVSADAQNAIGHDGWTAQVVETPHSPDLPLGSIRSGSIRRRPGRRRPPQRGWAESLPGRAHLSSRSSLRRAVVSSWYRSLRCADGIQTPPSRPLIHPPRQNKGC